MSTPEVWISLRGMLDLADFEQETIDEIVAGRLTVYDISVIEAREDENWDDTDRWNVLEFCGLYIGAPGCDNVYSHPSRIPDSYLRYFAMDMWAWQFRFRPGEIVLRDGVSYVVVSPLTLDDGYHSGWLTCWSLSPHGRRGFCLLPVEDVSRVRALTA
ncbi:hypothetical protein AB0M10_15210 [Streptomyces sp. NPDC051840]|uniref:hypothetical protein n=1 Tax=Streptomyces sp. NPDC051840 TaxID=3154752 RepID=UPI003440BD8C